MNSQTYIHSAEGALSHGSAPMDAEHVKALRVSIRRLRNTANISHKPSRYLSMVSTSLEKAAMWLGDILSVLGEAYPYPEDRAVPMTDNPTDTYADHNDQWATTKESEKLKAYRAVLGDLTRQLAIWATTPQLLHPEEPWKDYKQAEAIVSAYRHLREARLDLGMLLGEALQQEAVPGEEAP